MSYVSTQLQPDSLRGAIHDIPLPLADDSLEMLKTKVIIKPIIPAYSEPVAFDHVQDIGELVLCLKEFQTLPDYS